MNTDTNYICPTTPVVSLVMTSITVAGSKSISEGGFLNFDSITSDISIQVTSSTIGTSSASTTALGQFGLGGGFLKVNSKSTKGTVTQSTFTTISSIIDNGGVFYLTSSGKITFEISHSTFAGIAAQLKGGMVYLTSKADLSVSLSNNAFSCKD